MCTVHPGRDGKKKVQNKTGGCMKKPSFGVTGTKTAEYCAQHIQDGVVNVGKRK